MTDSHPSPPPSAAVAAFLRGLDRRARLLALVQSGDAQAAPRALDAAARVFASEAGQWPIAQWPRQYWRLLLSTPSMRQTGAVTAGPLPGIARLPPQVRAALLLHLVAALDEADAAAALGIEVDAYQLRIRDALPRDALGQPDLDVWRAWRAAAQRALDALPETAPAAPAPAPSTAQPDQGADAARHRRRMRWLWLGVAVCAFALLASFFLHQRGRELLDSWRNHVQVEPLPPAVAPKARFDPADPALHPDRALLAEPGTLQLARQLPLLAWLANEAADALPPPPLAPAFPDTASAAADDPLAGSDLSERIRAWDRLSPSQRAQQRGALEEWQALPAEEQALLGRLAARFAALPSAEQLALRERYASLSFDAHRGWHLGPRLGRDWPRIGALFAYVEPGEREALLRLLRSASAEELDTLARLAQITPPEARTALRRELLAQAPAQRATWLQARLQQ
ncbi:DUF3106 domain-containing protein [Thermomonas fusca]|uniref:DUF3106 domain-containing protein n=1 Tax=Thermomonas fusca TaxID=215690 RepID=A0A5R9PIJ4_9GAMM|nr:DUF3106 domain-containing protein [Thermomonas fusca]TLX22813.1 DUF3106 domain-containing protein [Thermomonas fusca]